MQRPWLTVRTADPRAENRTSLHDDSAALTSVSHTLSPVPHSIWITASSTPPKLITYNSTYALTLQYAAAAAYSIRLRDRTSSNRKASWCSKVGA